MRQTLARCLVAAVVSSGALTAGAQVSQPDGGGVVRGVLPDRWAPSGPQCGPNPAFQVHQYNVDLYILRESGCSNYEKPFIYLLFGRDRVLMLDTGAGQTDIAQVVHRTIDEWMTATHRTDRPPLIVAHTHAHGDHISGDSQMRAEAGATVVGLPPASVQQFFGFKNWPNDIVQYDLGGRVLDVIAIPGHQASSIAVYDRQTGVLFTGDSLYPGRLYVADGPEFVKSVQRLVNFTRGRIVTHILGNHIEQTRTPYLDYPVRTVYQPDEHVLELGRSQLLELNDALQDMHGPIVRRALRDFTIWPN